MEPLTVSGTLNSLSEIANYVISAANEAGLDKKTTYKLRLAVDEIATNIIIHGYEEAGCTGTIDVLAKLDSQRLSISLEDTGAIFDPTQRSTPDHLNLSLEKRPLGGLGVYLAIQSVDRFIYERIGDRNQTTFIVYRSPSNTKEATVTDIKLGEGVEK